MSETAQVTAIVTFYNRERYLAEAVESVLAQDRDDLHIVLVDDGSTDSSHSVARAFEPPAEVVRQENRGSAGAMNTGVRTATTEFVAFCDSDDIWRAGKLDAQLAAFERDPSLDLVFTNVEEFLSPEINREDVRTRPLRGAVPGCAPSTLLARRSAFQQVGPLDEGLRNGAWVDWYARARWAGLREHILPDILVRRRIHAQNNFALQTDAHIGYLRAVRAMVQRRRSDS